jgi:hypothetical protein
MQANAKTDAHHEGLMFEVQKLRRNCFHRAFYPKLASASSVPRENSESENELVWNLALFDHGICFEFGFSSFEFFGF